VLLSAGSRCFKRCQARFDVFDLDPFIGMIS
jgi:hypothetical protein